MWQPAKIKGQGQGGADGKADANAHSYNTTGPFDSAQSGSCLGWIIVRIHIHGATICRKVMFVKLFLSKNDK
jgi:hypothetical protein